MTVSHVVFPSTLQVPANYSAPSPDGRLLVSVGDSTTGHLHMSTESGYTLCGAFSEASDSGMVRGCLCLLTSTKPWVSGVTNNGDAAVMEYGISQADSLANKCNFCCQGCDWAPGGSCLAAAFQDGTVLLYDHRAGKTIHK